MTQDCDPGVAVGLSLQVGVQANKSSWSHSVVLPYCGCGWLLDDRVWVWAFKCVCVWTFECVSLHVIGVCLHAHICEYGHLYACLRFMLICPLAPARGNWHYHYWHLVISGQNTGAKAKCFEPCKFMMSLLAVVILITKSHYWNPRSHSAAAWVASSTALVYMFNNMYRCGETLHLYTCTTECRYGETLHLYPCTTVCTGVGKQPEWQVTLYLYTCTTVCSGVGKWLCMLPAHPALGSGI